jgi:uncharacterized lipoprotein YddW (UPF0748 family)
MFRRPSRVLVFLLALAATVFAAAGTPGVSARRAQSDEVRGLWVLRTTLGSERTIREMVDAARRGGFNTLLVQVRGRGDAYYRSDIEPRGLEIEDDATAFDPLAVTIDAAHAAGLRVHAWFNTDLVSSAVSLPRSTKHVVSRHPEWLMVPKPLAAKLSTTAPDLPSYVGDLARWTRGQSDRVEGLYLSPITAASRQYTTSVVSDLVRRYDLDGLHLDYIRYPGEQFDYSAAALSEFRAERAPVLPAAEVSRLDRLARTSATAWADAAPETYADFRRARLTRLLTSIRATVDTLKPGMPISAAVIPDAAEARNSRLQDWREWARAGLVDTLCPMIYTTDPAEFRASVARVNADAGRASVWAGIGAYRLSPARTSDNVRAVWRAGMEGVLLFSYDSLTAADAPANYFAQIRAALTESGSSRR